VKKLLLLFILLSISVFANDKKVPQKDIAIFRIVNDVYFLSDIINIKSSLQKLDCLLGGAFLNETLKVQYEKLLINSNSNISDLKNNNLEIIKIIKIKKLEKHFENHKNLFSKAQINKQISQNRKSCGLLNNLALTSRLINLLQIEFYLQERFLVSNIKGESLKQDQIASSVSKFIDTISTKIAHNVYY
jgi:hypothetical protein